MHRFAHCPYGCVVRSQYQVATVLSLVAYACLNLFRWCFPKHSDRGCGCALACCHQVQPACNVRHAMLQRHCAIRRNAQRARRNVQPEKARGCADMWHTTWHQLLCTVCPARAATAHRHVSRCTWQVLKYNTLHAALQGVFGLCCDEDSVDSTTLEPQARAASPRTHE
jgi:hypothetical protein